jgi:hypothetical protein
MTEQLARRAVLLAALVGAGALLAHMVNWALDVPFRDLDADAEANFMTWLGTVGAFAAALMAGLHAAVLREGRVLWALLAASLAFLSADDAILIHERLADKVADRLGDVEGAAVDVLQLALTSPALAVAFVGSWTVARGAPPQARRALLIGLACLVGAVATELVWGGALKALDAEDGFVDALRLGVEEAFELAGWISLAGGLAAVALAALPR